jgi:hypothetical protein
MQRSTRKATLSPATAFQLWMAVVTMTALHVLHWRHSTHWLLLHARQSTAVLGPPAAQNAETPIRLVGGGWNVSRVRRCGKGGAAPRGCWSSRWRARSGWWRWVAAAPAPPSRRGAMRRVGWPEGHHGSMGSRPFCSSSAPGRTGSIRSPIPGVGRLRKRVDPNPMQAYLERICLAPSRRRPPSTSWIRRLERRSEIHTALLVLSIHTVWETVACSSRDPN